MAEVAGKGGSVTFTNLTAGVKSWSLNKVQDFEDKTDYGDSGHKTYLACCDDWTASCELNWDADNSVDTGDSATLTLTIVSGTTYYSGPALVASIAVNSVVNGIVSATVNFQGNGELTLTTP